jgi:putative acetyltransferase
MPEGRNRGAFGPLNQESFYSSGYISPSVEELLFRSTERNDYEPGGGLLPTDAGAGRAQGRPGPRQGRAVPVSADVKVRPATAADAEAIIAVHFAAVHETAAAFYSSEVLDRWSGPPNEARYQRMRDAIAKGDELFLVAQDPSGVVVGFGSIVPRLQELHAVYVHPRAGRLGIGTQILGRLERVAVKRRVVQLHLDASVNAAAFYQRAGYEIVDSGVFDLGGGVVMTSVKMKKDLAA